MDARSISELDRSIRRNFTYETDGTYDTWRSHYQDWYNHKPWKGDCDDLASTLLDGFARNGVPLSNLFMLMLDTTGNGQVDHMVACIKDDDNVFHIVADTLTPRAYAPAELKHTILEYRNMEEVNAKGHPVWRSGAPFTL